MRSKFTLVIVLLLATVLVQAQVTIGSGKAPVKGALLDLKDGEDYGDTNVTATKGLGLPRVELEDRGKLTLVVDAANQADVDEAHIGLLVYNAEEKVSDTEINLCKGLHVWDGKKWEPLKPYPIIEAPEEETTTTVENKPLPPNVANLYPMGHLGYIEDIRGDAPDWEYNRYSYARFFADSIISTTTTTYTGVKPSCTSDGESISWIGDEVRTATFNDGVWMTQNMNTRYFPDNTLINGGTPSATTDINVAQFAYPSSTGALTATDYWDRSHGILYNYRATVNKVVDLTNEEGQQIHEVRQGICPSGWHIPSNMEIEGLTTVLGGNADAGTLMRSLTRLAGSILDISDASSASADMGGFNSLLVGEAHNSSAYSHGHKGYLRSSSSYGSYDELAWARRLNHDSAVINPMASSSFNLYSVRCKKDAE